MAAAIIDIRDVRTGAVPTPRCRHVRLKINRVILQVGILRRVGVHRRRRALEHTVLWIGIQVMNKSDAVLVGITHVLALVDVIVEDAGSIAPLRRALVVARKDTGQYNLSEIPQISLETTM